MSALREQIASMIDNSLSGFDSYGEALRIADAIMALPPIAAGRELYEALEGLTRFAEAVRHTAGMGKNQLARFEAAKAALARARGETL